MNKSIEFLNSLDLSKEKNMIVGCSGGPDSMCLLYLLLEQGYKIVCAHVDHNIREESAQEYEFLKSYCQEKKVIFEGLRLPKIEHGNESHYRKKRYEFYKKLAIQYDTPYIMTAHHGDDLIETILMRISRGSNLKGYRGFSKIYKENRFTFIKPLVFYTKDDILQYIQKKDIPFVHDTTNDEDVYTRNRYRHKVLPFLKKETKDVHLKYLQFSEELDKANDFMESVVERELQTNFDGHKLDLTRFGSLDDFIRRKELERILKVVYRDDVDKLKVFHTEAILNNIEKGNNFVLDMPLGMNVRREYNYLLIEKKNNRESYNIELKSFNSLPNGDIIEVLDDSDDTSNYTTRLNTKEVNMPLYIRTRREGDKMDVKNMKGSKKIKTIFIDSKVAPSKRTTYPILTDSLGNILWIPGIKKSKFDINKDGKYDIILRYTQGKENTDEKK